MPRPRITIARLMAVVIFLGSGFAALRNADPFWASASYTLAITMITAAFVGALARKGAARTAWIGFAAFGWAHLLVDILPPRTVGVFGFGPIPWPPLLIEYGIGGLQPYINRSAPGVDPSSYEQVSHSLGVILFGLVGAVLVRLLAVKDERPEP